MLTLYTCKLEETAFKYGMELNLQHPTNHFNEFFKQKLSFPGMCVCREETKVMVAQSDQSISNAKMNLYFSEFDLADDQLSRDNRPHSSFLGIWAKK